MSESYDALKVPPHSVQDEQSVIGGLLMAAQLGDGSAWSKVAGLLQVEHFYRQTHRLIFTAMLALAGDSKPLDIGTVTTWLADRNELENAGGFVYLVQMSRDTPSVANIGFYAETVFYKYLLRQLITVGSRLADAAFNTPSTADDVKTLIEGGVKDMFALEQRGSANDGGLRIIKPILKEVLAAKELAVKDYVAGGAKLKGFPTGFGVLDKRWSGLEKGRVYTLAGRPSMGKSAQALQIADFLAQWFAAHGSEYFVSIFSLEMPEHELVDRLIACSGRADYGKLREPWLLDEDDWATVARGVKQLGGTDLFMDCSETLKPAQIRQRVRRTASESRKKPGLIVIDHLQLMAGDKKAYANDNAEMSDITRDIKRLAKALDVPIIQLSQLNRGVENRQNKRPVLADLRESGSIEQDSDFVQFLYRESQYNPDCGHSDVEFIHAKARAAQLGTDLVVWKGSLQRFEKRAFEGDYQGGGAW